MPQACDGRNNKMVYGTHAKVEYLRDTSIQPYQTKKESMEFILPKGVKEANVTVSLKYFLLPPDKQYEIHTVTKRVVLQ